MNREIAANTIRSKPDASQQDPIQERLRQEADDLHKTFVARPVGNLILKGRKSATKASKWSCGFNGIEVQGGATRVKR